MAELEEELLSMDASSVNDRMDGRFRPTSSTHNTLTHMVALHHHHKKPITGNLWAENQQNAMETSNHHGNKQSPWQQASETE